MFKSDLALIVIPSAPDLWRFAAPLVWEDTDGTITIPKGFVTDLASIPHLLDWAPNLDRTGVSRRAAALHDGLYALGRARGKAYADDKLHAALIADGMPSAGADEYFYAVHWFGDDAYNSDAQVPIGHEGSFYTAEDYAAFMAAGGNIFTS